MDEWVFAPICVSTIEFIKAHALLVGFLHEFINDLFAFTNRFLTRVVLAMEVSVVWVVKVIVVIYVYFVFFRFSIAQCIRLSAYFAG